MAESVQVELQKAIYAALTSSAAVMALCDAVYDFVPEKPWSGPHNAYVSFGPAQTLNDDSECITGDEAFLQLDCWSRDKNSLSCKRLVDAVKAVLNNVTLPFDDNAMVGMSVEGTRIMRDPDGLTTHGIVSVTAFVEETA